jgi:hypothetical protein
MFVPSVAGEALDAQQVVFLHIPDSIDAFLPFR